MSLSAPTATLAYEDLRARAALAAMFRDSLFPVGGDPPAPAFADGTPPFVSAGLAQIAKLASGVGASAGSSPDPAPPRLIDSILSARSHEQILAALPPLGLGSIAKRLTYLHEITGDEDPDEPPMAFSSLQQCALFFASESGHADADLGISPDGLLQALWRPEGRGVLAIRFLPSGFLQFAGVSESSTPAERRRVHGTLPKDQALQAVRPFLPESRH